MNSSTAAAFPFISPTQSYKDELSQQVEGNKLRLEQAAELIDIAEFQKSFAALNESIERMFAPLRDLKLPIFSFDPKSFFPELAVPPEGLAWLGRPLVAPEAFTRFQEISAEWVN